MVTAEQVALVSGTATVTFANPLPGSKTQYVVLVTSSGANTALIGTLTNDSNGNFASFVITGTGSQVIHYAVISVGQPVHAPLL